MGLLLDFYAGDASVLGAAYNAGDVASVRAAAKAHADFSLHLSPNDLDILSEEAFAMTGGEPVGLLESLVGNVGGDGAESSADTLSEIWVAGFASFPEERVKELAERWMRGVAADRGQPEAVVTPDVLQAIRQLIAVCQTAKQHCLDVVHTWSL